MGQTRLLSLSSPPSLSPRLLIYYSGMSKEHQKVFSKVFLWVWRYLFGLRSFIERAGSLSVYWAIDQERQKIDLTASQLSVLSFLYYASGCGYQVLHSDTVYKSVILPDNKKTSKQNILLELKQMGYITRSTHNASAPYLSSSRNMHPVYIKMTDKAINLIQDIETNIYKILFNTSLNDLTGANKKPG